MAFSGWRYSCDRATLERCAGRLEIEAQDMVGRDHVERAYLAGAAASIRAILADGDGMDAEGMLAAVERSWRETAGEAGGDGR